MRASACVDSKNVALVNEQGTLMVAPDSRVAGFTALFAVSPRTPVRSGDRELRDRATLRTDGIVVGIDQPSRFHLFMNSVLSMLLVLIMICS